ncbi:hypothetical protein GGTG_00313 [Gaeumannomyces tritici R3-111a-1]|uniref:Uncharacterized protein n=1 Tax=Gaeumannomyces tritici (strain R3-111a-1) TaxID=644352 RepID=J3NGC2_GAET3|nr:hypothetical protein GGTG_00313 [Gaeumannomyces tritici R3-111a-1]EJT80312.1 hypothetical protein GGTG_00313 [Gaeumannomyces tritici R3-111a-1]
MAGNFNTGGGETTEIANGNGTPLFIFILVVEMGGPHFLRRGQTRTPSAPPRSRASSVLREAKDCRLEHFLPGESGPRI